MRAQAPTGCHYFPKWVTGLWLSLGIAILLFGVGCRRTAPPVDLGPKTPTGRSTVTGVVRGVNGGASGMAGRTVEIVNTATGERQTVKTADNGGFTAVVPAGRYRFDLSLREGETIVKRPTVLNVSTGELDPQVEFVVGPVRVLHPRGAGSHVDNGLGSPVARLRQGFAGANPAGLL